MPVGNDEEGRSQAAVKQLQQELDDSSKEAGLRRAEANPKEEEAARAREMELRSATAVASVEAVVQRITTLGLDVQKSLAGISGQLTSEVDRLRELRDAAELERAELSRLHKIDIAAANMPEGRVLPRKEHRARPVGAAVERERKEQEDNLRKARQREAEEFEDKKAQARKRAHAKYGEGQPLVEPNAKLKEPEDELKQLRAELAKFPDRSSYGGRKGSRRCTYSRGGACPHARQSDRDGAGQAALPAELITPAPQAARCDSNHAPPWFR